jgi:hypothetical protein
MTPYNGNNTSNIKRNRAKTATLLFRMTEKELKKDGNTCLNWCEK